MEESDFFQKFKIETISGALTANGTAFRLVAVIVDTPSEVTGCRDVVRVNVRVNDSAGRSLADVEAAAWRAAAQAMRAAAEKIEGST